MSFSFAQITSWLLQYKYFALFPLAVIEGPIITIITGFFSSLGYINFLGAYAVIVAGDLAGDVLHYIIGRFGGRKFIDKWGRFIGVGEREVELVEKQFTKRGDKLLFIGKMSHGVGGAFLVAAGIIKMPFDRFFFSNFLATLVKSLILLIIGFYFGHAFAAINSYLEKFAVLSVAIAVTLLIAYLFYHHHKNNKHE
ncbi:MAG: DedA family protein [Candidatus Parcubacteria bacterium]|nr:DedA family protein [Candidatus Parcubacteria bacterium]